MDSLTLAKTAAGILDAKKADQINVIRISDVSSLGDYFVLANGTGSTHVHALADELEFPQVAILTWPHPGERPGSGSLLELPVENAADVELVTLEQNAPGTLLATLQNRTLHPVAVSGAETLPPWQLHQCTITRK